MAKKQKRSVEQDRPLKSTRVPTLPPQTQVLVNLLNQMLDNPETDQERRALAYGTLTRLSVLWAPPVNRERLTIAGELVSYHEDDPGAARVRLSSSNPLIVNELITLMALLFPGGEGLPLQEGCSL